MLISSKLEEYIIQCLQVSKSNIIITDLEKVKFSKSLETNNNYSIDNYNLSIQVKQLTTQISQILIRIFYLIIMNVLKY